MSELTVGMVEELIGARVARLLPLAGDASTRCYYRATMEMGGTFVVMFAPTKNDVALFGQTTEVMSSLGVDVPVIHSTHGRLMALEDCGDELLQRFSATATEPENLALYRKIIDGLITFQISATTTRNRSAACYSLAFDIEKLTFETEFTQKHFVEGFLRKDESLPTKETAKLRSAWASVIAELAVDQETLCHRDFHSRNILLHEERLVWLDHQDARMGRATYDLASLLFDPYVKLTDKTRHDLACYYFAQRQQRNVALWNEERFWTLYDYSGAQRLYKALGTFGYQATQRGITEYVQYMPETIRQLRNIIDHRSELFALQQAVSGAFETMDNV